MLEMRGTFIFESSYGVGHPRRLAAHEETKVRPHRDDLFRGRTLWQLRPGQLQLCQDGSRRSEQYSGHRGRSERHQLQRDRADGGVEVD